MTFAASSFGVDRELTISDGSDEIARFNLSTTESHEFQFVAPVGRALTFRSSPTADPVVKYDPASADPRSLSIRVSGWGVDKDEPAVSSANGLMGGSHGARSNERLRDAR